MGHSRAPKTQTMRTENAVACATHLRDLRRAHGHAPPDIVVARQSVPQRLAAEPASSNCTSPGELCAELAR
jgi:hypothetical protein